MGTLTSLESLGRPTVRSRTNTASTLFRSKDRRSSTLEVSGSQETGPPWPAMAFGMLTTRPSSSGASCMTSKAPRRRSEKQDSRNASRFVSKRGDEGRAEPQVARHGLRRSRRRWGWLVLVLGRVLVHVRSRQPARARLLFLLLGCQAVCPDRRIGGVRPGAPEAGATAGHGAAA